MRYRIFYASCGLLVILEIIHSALDLSVHGCQVPVAVTAKKEEVTEAQAAVTYFV
jgi:hypothetical protein